MMIPRPLFLPQRKLPDSVLAELVTMLIAGRVPIIVMALTVALVTAFAVSAGLKVIIVWPQR